jgi:hypothetical protein
MENTLKVKIMRRIYLISYCRKASTIFALKIYFAILLIIGLLYNVSILSVFNNLVIVGGSGVGELSHFSGSAFMNTELTVQAIFVLTLLFAIFVMVNSVRGGWYQKGD